VRGEPRIAQALRVDVDDAAPANRRSAALQLVDREVDALAKETRQGAFQAFLADQTFEVAVFAAGETEELAIGILPRRVDSPADERQEVGFSAPETPAQDGAGLVERDRVSQEAGKLSKKARREGDISQGRGGAGRSPTASVLAAHRSARRPAPAVRVDGEARGHPKGARPLVPSCHARTSASRTDRPPPGKDEAWGPSSARLPVLYRQIAVSRRPWFVVISPFSTDCPYPCPDLMRSLTELQLWLGPRQGGRVLLLSVSVDPRTDNPPRLAVFAGRTRARPGWLFLSGRTDDVEAVLGALGLQPLAPGYVPPTVIVANVPAGIWKRLPAAMPPGELIRVVESVLTGQE
jgi:hypothetical protein